MKRPCYPETPSSEPQSGAPDPNLGSIPLPAAGGPPGRAPIMEMWGTWTKQPQPSADCAIILGMDINSEPVNVEGLLYPVTQNCCFCDGRGFRPVLFGRNIRIYRKMALKLSLRETARQLGLSPAYLSDIELERRNVPTDLPERLRALKEAAS